MTEKRKSGGVKKGDDVWIKIKPYRDAPVRGVVKDVLTNKTYHPRGIKVRLKDGRVGRVVEGARDDEDLRTTGALYSIGAVVACALGAGWFISKLDGGA